MGARGQSLVSQIAQVGRSRARARHREGAAQRGARVTASKLINVTPAPDQGQRDGTDAPKRGPRRCPQRNRYKRVLVPRRVRE